MRRASRPEDRSLSPCTSSTRPDPGNHRGGGTGPPPRYRSSTDREGAVKAFVRAQYGPPDVLEFEDVDSPVVKDDDVLVRVHASSLNQGDLDYLYGKPFLTRMGIGLRAPRHRGLGFDAAGQIEAVGKDITRFQPGDAVFGDLTQFGHSAFAEYAIAPERAWALKPSSMSYEKAATLPQAAILALQGLRGRGGIAKGNTVLINGASGSVGPFAVQIAKALGAHVTGVCSTKKTDMVRGLGADEVIDYTLEDYTRGGPGTTGFSMWQATVRSSSAAAH